MAPPAGTVENASVVMAAGRCAGRERELQRLTGLLEDAHAGRGRAALVEGEAGIGKTTLVEVIADVAAQRGMRVAFGRCTPSSTPAAWPWQQIAAALDVPLRDVLSAEHDATRPAVLARAVEALRPGIAQGPVLVVIEDAHWADTTTLALTAFVASTARDLPLTLLVTARDEPWRGQVDGVLDMTTLPTSMVRLTLHGLDADAARALVNGVTGVVIDDAVARRIHERTAGNPFFMEEVARLWVMRGRAAAVEVPEGVSHVLRRRVARLAQPAFGVLSAAAVLGELDAELLAAMTGESEDHALGMLEQSVAIGVVRFRDGGYRFAHDLVRDTVVESLAPVTRARWHRRAAEALEAVQPSEHSRIAVHWRNAGGRAAHRRAAEHALRAADAAMHTTGYEQAIRFYTWALDGGVADRLGAMVGLGEAQVLAGDLRSGRVTLRAAAAQASRRDDGEALARAVLMMGTGIGGFEVDIDDDDQRTMLERALRLLPEGDSAVRAAVLARLSLARALVATMDDRAATAEAAAAMAARVGDAAVEVSALAALCDARSGPAHVDTRATVTQHMLELAREAANPHLILLARRLRLMVLLERGDHAGVDREITEYELVAERLHVPLLQWPVPVWRGMRALMRDDAAEAQRWSDVAEGIARRAHSPNADLMVATLRMAIARAGGRGCDPRDCLPPDALGLVEWYPPAWCIMAAAYAEAGRDEEARAYVRRVMDRGIDVIADDSELLETLWDLGDAAILLRDAGVARAVLDALTPYEDLWAVDGMGGACFGRVRDQTARLRCFLDGAPGDDGARAAQTIDEGAMRRRGDVWEVRWRGRSALVRDSKGLRDIAVLVGRPGVGVPATDLVAAAGGPAPDGTGGGELLDAQARAEYQARIRELDLDIAGADANADPERLANAKAERDILMAELSRALGLGRRPRRTGDRGERARTAVTTRIATAVRGLERPLPELARHLRASLDTGRVCTYAPERPVRWTVS